jgi:hypothetical protein
LEGTEMFSEFLKKSVQNIFCHQAGMRINALILKPITVTAIDIASVCNF